MQNLIAFTPADPASAADVAAARHADQLFNRLFIDAAVRGVVDDDADGVVDPGERRPAMARKADFIGVNYYFRGRVTALGAPVTQRLPLLDFLYATFYRTPDDPDAPECPTLCTEFGTEVYPEGLRQVLTTAGQLRPAGLHHRERPGRRRRRPARVLRPVAPRASCARRWPTASRTCAATSTGRSSTTSSGRTATRPRFGLYSYDPRTLARRPRPSAAVLRKVFRTRSLPAG